MKIPQPVRRQALNPFAELPSPPGFRNVEREHFVATLHPLPIAQVVTPRTLEPGDVAAAVEEARRVVRDHGRELLTWLVGPEHDELCGSLVQCGLVNEDTPGFEAVENAMALVEPPSGTAPAGIDVTEVETFQQFAASERLTAEVFELTPAMRAQGEAELPERYEEYATSGNPMRKLNASIEGKVVGTATAAFGPAGINLFGGAVTPDARGRGVYRALTLARWNLAVARGTPALTLQAGRMSKPIAERLGFRFIAAMKVFVDDFGTPPRGAGTP